MTDPNSAEPQRIGRFTVDPDRHEGFSFTDEEGLTHAYTDLTESPEAGLIEADVTLSDDQGPLIGPERVVIAAETEVHEAKSFTAYIKDHKVAAAGVGVSALGAVVTVGTLVLRHKQKTK